jgi:hypothetical protein
MLRATSVGRVRRRWRDSLPPVAPEAGPGGRGRAVRRGLALGAEVRRRLWWRLRAAALSVLSDDAPVGASPGGNAKEATRRRRRVTTTVQSNDGVVRPAACPPPDCCLQPSAQRPCAHDTVCHSVRPTGGESRTLSKRQLDCAHAPSSAWRLHEFKFLHKQHEEVAQASLRGKQMPAKMTYSGVALNERGPRFRIHTPTTR